MRPRTRWLPRPALSASRGWSCLRSLRAAFRSRAIAGASRSRPSFNARASTSCSRCWQCSATGSCAATTVSSSRIEETSASTHFWSPLRLCSCLPEPCSRFGWCRSQPHWWSALCLRPTGPSPRSASGSSPVVLEPMPARSSCSCWQSRSESSPPPIAGPGTARRSTRPSTPRVPTCSWSPALLLARPGRPTRLAFSVQLAELRGPPPAPLPPGSERPAPPSLFVYVRDGDGVLHGYRLGELGLGRARRFELDLGDRPRYPLGIVALELDRDVPYLVPRRATFHVRSLSVAAGPEARWHRVALDERWRASARGFDRPYLRPRVEKVSARGGSVATTFSTGSHVSGVGSDAPATDLLLRPGSDSLPRVAPVLASDTFLTATNASVGEVVPLALAAGSQAVRIVGSFHRFPTLDPALPAVVADLPTYVAVLFATHGDVVPPSQWWLKANGGQVAGQLRAPPFRSLEVVSRSERERALLEDPVPLGVIGALALGFVVAAAFAAVGFAASAAAAARARMLEFAVLRSLGLRTSQLSGWISIESGLVVALSLLGGTVLGLLVSWLVLPYVALGTGAEPVPPVLVTVPWKTVLLLESALLAALVAVSAFQVVRIRALRPAPMLRSGEGALAP